MYKHNRQENFLTNVDAKTMVPLSGNPFDQRRMIQTILFHWQCHILNHSNKIIFSFFKMSFHSLIIPLTDRSFEQAQLYCLWIQSRFFKISSYVSLENHVIILTGAFLARGESFVQNVLIFFTLHEKYQSFRP